MADGWPLDPVLRLSIEGLPPTVNGQYQHTRYNTRLKPEAKAWRWSTSVQVRMQRNAQQGARWEPAPGDIFFLSVDFVSPRWVARGKKAKGNVRKIDADNRLKALFDALQDALGLPDERIFEFRVRKVVGKDERSLVTIWSRPL